MAEDITNVVVAGLGGQGVLTCSDVLSAAAFIAGHDVKKAVVHGMSQRGGSVTCDVRFGRKVLSPMVPREEADFLLVLEETQIEPTRYRLKPGGVLLHAGQVNAAELPTAKALNIAMLGMLSAHLDLPESAWHDAIRSQLAEKLHAVNLQAFAWGQAAGERGKNHA